jgi:putative addiction module component (TIGR02574 family)
MQTVMQEVEKLSTAEKLDLVQDIWDSIPAEALRPDEIQLQELRRRLKEHDADPTTAISSEEMNRLLAGLRKKT